jgi:hypothetical protein
LRVRAFLSSALVILGFSISSARAATIDFENLPDAYFFNGGGQSIDNFFSGITFGPDVTSLSISRFGGYDDSGFPPHSGDVVIWDAADPTINIAFTSGIQSFGIWYTSFDPLTLEAFGAGNNSLGSVIGNPNTDGSTGTSSLLSFSGSGIRSVSFTSSAGFFVLDDLTFQSATTNVPEPSSITLLLTSLILLKFKGRR